MATYGQKYEVEYDFEKITYLVIGMIVTGPDLTACVRGPESHAERILRS